MKNYIIFLLMLCSMLSAPCIYADQAEVLFPGGASDLDLPNYGSELKGSDFLALYKADGKFFISKTKVTYSGVISSSTNNAIAFIRGISLKIGEVQAANVHWSNKKRIPWVSENKMEISFKDQTYYMYKDKGSFFLIGNDGKSELYSGRDDLGIIWAGDIDGDGKLDLIITSNGGDGKNAVSCLLLSSIAKKPALVKEFACQFYSG